MCKLFLNAKEQCVIKNRPINKSLSLLCSLVYLSVLWGKILIITEDMDVIISKHCVGVQICNLKKCFNVSGI